MPILLSRNYVAMSKINDVLNRGIVILSCLYHNDNLCMCSQSQALSSRSDATLLLHWWVRHISHKDEIYVDQRPAGGQIRSAGMYYLHRGTVAVPAVVNYPTGQS